MKRKIISVMLLSAICTSFLGTSRVVKAAENSNAVQENAITDGEHFFGDNLDEEEPVLVHKSGSNDNDCSRSQVYEDKNGVLDLSKERYFPGIANQGSEGSCTAFAGTYYAFSFEVSRKANAQLKFSPKWTYNLSNDGMDNGSTVWDNYKTLQKYGTLLWEEYPYNPGEHNAATAWSTDSSLWKKAQKYMIAEDGWDESPYCHGNNADIDGIKEVLKEGHLVNVSCYYDSINWINSSSNRIKGSEQNSNIGKVIYYCSPTKIDKKTNKEVELEEGHALTIVGYDDNVAVDINNDGKYEESEKGVFKIANSWGVKSDDKDQGFFWLSYDALNPKSKVEVAENASEKDKLYSTKRRKFANRTNYYWIKEVDIKEEPKLYATFTLNTKARRNCKVVLHAKNNNTDDEYEFEFDPFSLQRNTLSGYINKYKKYNDLSFNGDMVEADGSFAIDLSRVIPEINKDDLKDYTWSLEVTHIDDSNTNDNSLIIKSFDIVDDENNNTYVTDSTSLPKSLAKGDSKTISVRFRKSKSGWSEEGGKKYYYINGVKQTGWKVIDGKKYHMDSNGAMNIGWFKDGDSWYYFNADTGMKTGWLQDEDKWYYLNTDGVMKTGWLQDKGKWYYLTEDGSMKKGWLQDGGKWYYLRESGEMIELDWLQENGTYYYFDKDGAMKKSDWVLDKGKWYYLTEDGSMKTGWLQYEGKWYYLSDTTGEMLTNTTTPDGYYVNGDGVCV